MRKRVVVLFLVLALGFSLFAGPSANLYDLVVPEEYTYLYLGSLGTTRFPDDIIQLNINFTPTTSFGMALGMDGEYRWYRQTLDTDMDLPADAYIQITDTSFTFDLDTSPSYRSYTLEFSGIPSFWGSGIDFDVNANLPFSGTSTASLDLSVYGEVGIGRIYSISMLKTIETIMEHLNITPTEQMVREVAEIMYNKQQITNGFSDDYSQNWLSYYRSIAQAMGIPEKTDELILIDHSQKYQFDVARYAGLRKGWMAALRFVPGLIYTKGFITSSTDFNGSLYLYGEYAEFLIDETLHLNADAGIRVGLDTSLSPSFNATVGTTGTVTYLPEDYRWWANGTISVNFITTRTEKLSFELDSRLNYLINPNFTVYGGLGVSTITDKLSVFAGGQIRIW
ncbi:hypothetical protein [Pleomorphochaeta sp. DL1XJH-081]|uniref:hypothetical protein n=1 Tax=Pleomorphochaeta sp. DL1XJH-081 TaxID=3409690 RepID=UPI003BB5B107